MHCKHALVQRLEFSRFFFGETALAGGNVETLLSIEDTFALSSESGKGVATGLFGLSRDTESVPGRRDITLFDESDFLFDRIHFLLLFLFSSQLSLFVDSR